jgi:hypothetical protein
MRVITRLPIWRSEESQQRLRPCLAEPPSRFALRRPRERGLSTVARFFSGAKVEAPAPVKKSWRLLLIIHVLASAGFAVAAVAVVAAHDVSRSEAILSIEGATVRVQFSINLLELRGVDANGDERVSYDELDARIEDVFTVIKQHFVLAAPDRPTRVVLQRQQVVEEHILQADLVYTFDRPVRELRVESTLETVTTPGHVHHVRTDISGETFQALLTPQNRGAIFLVGGVTIGRIAIVLLALVGIAAIIASRVIGQRPRR